MKVLKENLSGIIVLTLKGEFDSFVTTPFSNEIARVLEDGTAKIVLNMRLIKFINSTALGAMIKARKACRAAGGDMVVSQPSAAAREAMESLGLDRLFAIHDDDESAIAQLDKDASVELSRESETAVMIHPPGSTRPIVGRLRRLEADTIECRVPSEAQGLTRGREMRLKFRLPLYRKEYFEVSARIETVGEDGDQGLVVMHFTDISDADREAIETFVSDMQELRDAARGGN